MLPKISPKFLVGNCRASRHQNPAFATEPPAATTMSTETSLDLTSLVASLPVPVEASNSNTHSNLDPQCVPPQLRRKMPTASPGLDSHPGVPLGRHSEFTPVKLEGAQRAHAINALRRRAIAAAAAQVDVERMEMEQ